MTPAASSAAPLVPLFDLGRQNAPILDEMLAEIGRLARASAFIGGEPVEAFEKEFTSFCGASHGVAVSSGTEALRLALLALDLQPGDEVITSPFTFIATAEAITHAGGKVVFADVDSATGNLDPAAVDAAVGPRTRGLVAVHLFGRVADMDSLGAIARAHDLFLLEDAAQAHGATRAGRTAGSIGDAGTFSFYPSKNLGAFGEGGFVTAATAEVAGRVRLLRNHGQVGSYRHAIEGGNSRLDAMQCAVLRVKLRRLPGWNEDRRRVAAGYTEALRDLPGITPPEVAAGEEPVYHLYVLQAGDRDGLRDHLQARGIGCGVYYPVPLHLQECYRRLRHTPGAFPHAERLCERVLAIPCYPELTGDQQRRVIGAVREFALG